MKLKVHKIYTFEPGKNSPLPPLPILEKSCENDMLDKDPVEEAIKNEENPNEFILNPEKEKRSSINITEKKLLQEAIEEEQSKIDNQNIEQGRKVIFNHFHLLLYFKAIKMRKEKVCQMKK